MLALVPSRPRVDNVCSPIVPSSPRIDNMCIVTEQACPSIENVEEICGLRLKETCKVVCKTRHHAVVPKITCVKGLVWNADVSLLCEGTDAALYCFCHL